MHQPRYFRLGGLPTVLSNEFLDRRFLLRSASRELLKCALFDADNAIAVILPFFELRIRLIATFMQNSRRGISVCCGGISSLSIHLLCIQRPPAVLDCIKT